MNNAIVVCSMPKAMEEKAREYGLGKIECVSYSVFLDIQHKNEFIKQKFVIDELESFLNRLHTNIIGYTLGVEENEI